MKVRSTLTMLRVYYGVSFAFMGVYLPFFPTWLAARGITGVSMAAITALLPAMNVLGPPCFGLIADALGLRGWLLRFACGSALVAFLAVAWQAAAGAPSFIGLALAVAAFGFFRSPMTLMADVLAIEHASGGGTTYGRTRMWGSLGFLLAAVAFGQLADPRAMRALPFAITAGLVLALVTTFGLPARVPVPEQPRAAHIRELLASSDFQLLLATAFLSQVAHSSYDMIVSLHFAALGMTGGEIGIAWAIGVVAEIALMAWGQGLFVRFAPARLLAVGLAGAAVRWQLLAHVTSKPVLLALQPLHLLSFGLMWLPCLHFIQKRAPKHILATANAGFVASIGVGSVVGMLIWGPMFRSSGGSAVYSTASLVSASAFVVALIFGARVIRRDRALA